MMPIARKINESDEIKITTCEIIVAVENLIGRKLHNEEESKLFDLIQSKLKNLVG